MTTLLGPIQFEPAQFDEPEEEVVVSRRELVTQVISATALVFLPLGLVAFAIVHFWGRGIGWFDLGLAITLYDVWRRLPPARRAS